MDIDSIAPSDHEHGPIQEGRIFVRNVECEYTREAEHLVTTNIQKTWQDAPMPGTTFNARFYEIERLLPVVKECGDKYIWIGINLDRFDWSGIPRSWKDTIRAWKKGAKGARMRAIVEEKISEQDRENCRDWVEFLLSRGECHIR